MNLKTKSGIELFCSYQEREEDGLLTMHLKTSKNIEKISEIKEARELINMKIEMFTGFSMDRITIPHGILNLCCYLGDKLISKTNRITTYSQFLKKMKMKSSLYNEKYATDEPLTFRLEINVSCRKR